MQDLIAMPAPRAARAARRGVSALALAALLGAGAITVTLPALGGTAPAQAQDFGRPASFADLADKVRPAVVSIFTKNGSPMRGMGKGQDFFNFEDVPPGLRDFFEKFRKNMPNEHDEDRAPMRAQGSGFIISKDGYVVTNNHVIDKAEEITVQFDNQEKLTATLVGTDPRTDIALLKIKGDKQFDNILEFNSKPVRVGDWVLAVGNPFGLGGTVTAGIVSAMGRDIGSGPYDFLQIDAAVNRGNSGGPTVNMDGKVVGVNTAIFSPSGGSVGIAFAIPADLVKDVVAQLQKGGKVSRGWLGVSIQNVTQEIADSLDMKDAKGALISKILDEGPAAKSEIKVGDVIVEVNGKPISDSRDLARTIAGYSPSADVKLVLMRGGKRVETAIKLGTFPANPEQLASLDGDEHGGKQSFNELGLTLSPADQVKGAGTKGVAITDVDPESDAADKVRRGDVIVSIGNEPVSKPADVAALVKDAKAKGKKFVLLQVKTRDQLRFVPLSLESKKVESKDKKDQQNGEKSQEPKKF